jgi:hypothetical protein
MPFCQIQELRLLIQELSQVEIALLTRSCIDSMYGLISRSQEKVTQIVDQFEIDSIAVSQLFRSNTETAQYNRCDQFQLLRLHHDKNSF